MTKERSKISRPNTEYRTANVFPPISPNPIQVLRPDLVLVDYGPMTLTISAWADGEPRPVMAARAAAFALGLLEAMSSLQPLLKAPSGKIKNLRECSPLLRKAVRVCRAVSPELTGLAAVAGLTADKVLQVAVRLGADRVMVNNGGDIALFIGGAQRIKVGLKTRPKGKVTHLLEISAGDEIGGVATSGWTGRSFSTGAADIVSVWAGDCTTADAAATWIAGRARFNSIKVSQCLAKDLDPDTDIPLLKVTRKVGRLTLEEKETVLKAGLAEARRLLAGQVIRGAFLAVQGEVRWVCGPGSPEPEPFSKKSGNVEHRTSNIE